MDRHKTISSALQTAVSGLQAASLRAQVSANKIANVNTDGFQPSEVRQSTVYAAPGRASGVRAAVFAEDRERAGRAVSVTTDFIRLIEARATYRANAATIETASSLVRDSINLLA
ncbi:MAG: flagellar basal body protein [Rhodospirillaceae bacterium]